MNARGTTRDYLVARLERDAEDCEETAQILADLHAGKYPSVRLERDAEVRAALVERARENPLADNGAIGNGRSSDNVRPTQHGNGTEYLLARLARDHAEILKHLCRDEPVALDAIDRACRGKHGGDRRSADAQIKDDIVNLDPPKGNSREYALARLRRERPDLHEKVLAGEMTAHAAMVEAERKAARPIMDPRGEPRRCGGGPRGPA